MGAPLITRLGFVAALLPSLVGCGGGGGSGGGPSAGSPAPPVGNAMLLDTYNFALSDAGAESLRLTINSSFGRSEASEVIVDFRIEPAVGRYTFSNRSVVYENAAIAVTTTFGSIVIDIIEPMSLLPGEPPSNVMFTADISLEGRVEITVADGAVTLDRGGSLVATMPFDEFEALISMPLVRPLWQHQSSMAWAVLDLLRNLITASADALLSIDETLAMRTTISRDCDQFPEAPPSGALAQGSATLTWLGSGAIGNADRFTWDFTSCWLDTGTARTRLLDGRMRLDGLTRSASNGIITQIGFRLFDGLTTGGVFFEGLRIVDVRESESGGYVTLPLHDYVLTDGIRIIFDAP